MTHDSISFRMTNKQKCFQIFRPQVEAFGEKHALSPKQVFTLTLVLDELITNILSYGYGDLDEHPIDVTLAIDGTRLSLEISDDARPFNILTAPEPELEVPLEDRTRQIGGMGVHIVKKLMHCIEYKREDGRNIVRLEKDITDDNACTA
ncbi:ATP-binding protein [Salidesulfovibrio brasiliensis]|uniref:ATP-binding protein n=1 Tax=Salidesulfovibrio brasiliensis TaxID=221711 RepID=UPI0006CFCF15|nr:ATP-binding protein [Salidesulfovibrio brasiliensis]